MGVHGHISNASPSKCPGGTSQQGELDTAGKRCEHRILSSMPMPTAIICEMAMSTVAYSGLKSSLGMPSLTLSPSGDDRS